MRIGIDASRAFVNHPSGTENYSYQIIKSIASNARQDEILLFVGDDNSAQLPNTKSKAILIPRLWTQVGLAWQTWRTNLNVLFVPAHIVPFAKRFNLPVVVTVHDLRTEFLPQHSSFLQKLYLNQGAEWLRARLASNIIAVSESTKKDVIMRLRVKPEKVTVIYEGVDQSFFNFSKRFDTEEISRVHKKYLPMGGEYLLFVGTVQPRKNLVRLIQAFAKIALQQPDLKLLIAGKRGWLADEVYKTPSIFGLENKVVFADYVDREDLPYLYAGAKGMVLPSLYEGFGLPVVEAMAMGTPVVTSLISSLPEVGGELASYVNPLSVDDIARGLEEVLLKSSQPEVLNKWAGRFSWEDAGKKTYELLRRVGGAFREQD